MADKKPSPLESSFWLTGQEKRCLIVICGLFLVGIAARYFYLKHEMGKVYTPAGIEQTEASHE